MSKPKFRKITGDDNKSVATPVNDEQLEESLRGEIPSKDTLTNEVKTMPMPFIESMRSDISKNNNIDEVDSSTDGPKDPLSDMVHQTTEDIEIGDLTIDSNGVRQTTEEEKNSPDSLSPKCVDKRPDRAHIIALRRRDRHFNKTCAACGERKPMKQMDNGKADECDSCKE